MTAISLRGFASGADVADAMNLFAAGGSTNSPAWDVDTINKTKSSYRPDNGTTMGTIYSISSKRTAWSTKYQKPSAVYYTSEPNTTTTALSGPIRCTPGCDTILHVVPDPTESDRFLALCRLRRWVDLARLYVSRLPEARVRRW